MTVEADRADLAHHEDEMRGRDGFNYAILDSDETTLYGCVYVYPPDESAPPDAQASVSWWVTDAAVGTGLDRAVGAAVARWLADRWGLRELHLYP